jgi:hypothetical protein
MGNTTSNVSNNILAVDILKGQPLPPNPYGSTWRSGWRAILSVRQILAKVQTTVLFGNTLYLMNHDISQLDPQTAFVLFMNEFKNKNLKWGELPLPPPPTYQPLQMTGPTSPNITHRPISEGKVTLLSAGFEPFRGYWVEFAGNFFLGFPIFQDWAPVVIRDGPNYKGFQSSTNNPGSGSNGPGSAGPAGGTGGSSNPGNCPKP